MPKIFNSQNRLIFQFIFLIELLSLAGYLIPELRQILFGILCLAFLYLSLRKPHLAIYILLIELFISSKGYLFYFTYNGLIISIRIAFWLITISAWLARLANEIISKKIKLNKNFLENIFTKCQALIFLKNKNAKYYLIFFAILFLAFLNGLYQGSTFSNAFFDFNNWLYFALIFPIYEIFKKNKSNLENLGKIFIICIAWLSIKTFFLLYIFAHNIPVILLPIYKWIRTSGVGEITQMQGGFYRIFFQSHIFCLIAFFLILPRIAKKIQNQFEIKRILSEAKAKPKDGKNNNGMILNDTSTIAQCPKYAQNKINQKIRFLKHFLALTCTLAITLITFSRSFWLGLIVGLIFYGIAHLYQYGFKKTIQLTLIIIASLTLSLGIIASIVKFPYPDPLGGFDTAELIKKRAQTIKNEAAVASRWELLPKLRNEIKKNPITGQGFGATITYKSSDPRVLASSIDGTYTTYAFEWGWLDIWFKLGIFGLLIYLIIIFRIFWQNLKTTHQDSTSQNEGLAISLIAICTIHFFTPFLNHPLGIGALILMEVMNNFAFKKI